MPCHFRKFNNWRRYFGIQFIQDFGPFPSDAKILLILTALIAIELLKLFKICF